MLIVLRGNSGSGKSTTAVLLRQTAVERGCKQKIALIEQDYLRRSILKEKETEGTDNIDLIRQMVQFVLDRGYVVILEGILFSERYDSMLEAFAAGIESHFYYFDVSFEETLRRHSSKPNAHEFGETEMREWYKRLDTLHFTNETILSEDLSQESIIETILSDTKLA